MLHTNIAQVLVLERSTHQRYPMDQPWSDHAATSSEIRMSGYAQRHIALK
jgi:hypothetical protein